MTTYLPELLLAVLFCSMYIVEADDQHCWNKTNKVSVNVIGDNPNKILTFVQNDSGYAKNLECKWELRASDYSKPRQMLLNVRNVDFDDQNAARDQCDRSVDVFSFAVSGFPGQNSTISAKWYSNTDASSASKRLVLANLWNSSNYLTVEFKSDNKQVRSDAKGVEMDVLIMSEDYCHRSMLFHNGSCYLITDDKLTFTEAFEVSKSLRGNLVTFSSYDSLDQFIKSNNDRESVFPFARPLNLTEKVWTGLFSCSSNNLIEFKSREKDCHTNSTQNFVITQANLSNVSFELCRLSLEVNASGDPTFTCEPHNASLRALVHFVQVPSAIADLHPRLFRTCGLLDVCRNPVNFAETITTEATTTEAITTENTMTEAGVASSITNATIIEEQGWPWSFKASLAACILAIICLSVALALVENRRRTDECKYKRNLNLKDLESLRYLDAKSSG